MVTDIETESYTVYAALGIAYTLGGYMIIDTKYTNAITSLKRKFSRLFL